MGGIIGGGGSDVRRGGLWGDDCMLKLGLIILEVTKPPRNASMCMLSNCNSYTIKEVKNPSNY